VSGGGVGGREGAGVSGPDGAGVSGPDGTGVSGPDGSGLRRRRTALYSAVALAVVLGLFLVVLGTRKSASDQQAASPLVGRPAPPIVGTSITDGADFNLGSLHGRYVLVNFFASWCIPCQEEQHELIAFNHEPGGRTAVVGVLFEDTPAAARQYLARNGGDWPALADPTYQLALDYGVRGPPESFLIDPQGLVVAKFVGGITAARLQQLVSEGL
jgi:cytochrome c biogenesis protein CcmG, thiol:disulfide interchange protein DsbE